MMLRIENNTEIAECIGLWLAEGDNKTHREITFTNNCLPLINFFAQTIENLFKDYEIKPRVYIYSKIKCNFHFPKNYRVNYYIDIRSTKPYFIYRIGSVKIVKEWKSLIDESKQNKNLYADILRGFFAGEGNIKQGSHCNRACRIAQGTINKFIEEILNHFNISYRYSMNGRSYVITGKWNWDKLAQIKIADLHPIKKEKFWKLYESYKEDHYPKYHIKKNILKLLEKPYTTRELSKKFDRSQARIQDIVIPLKKNGILQSYRVRSKAYWINANQQKIIISKIKNKYIKSLKQKEKTTTELAKEIGVCWKAAYRRLNELKNLKLIIIDENGYWKRIPSKKEVIIL